MKTKLDLILSYNKETGIGLFPLSKSKRKDADYLNWLEDKYLEKLNEEESINSLFNQDE